MEPQKDALFINLMFDALRPLPGVDAAFIALKCKGRNRFNLRHSAFARQSREVRAMERHANGDIVGYGASRT